MITTRKGDYGNTCITFGSQVPKTHPMVGVVGDVDSLQVSLGMVRVYIGAEGYPPTHGFRRDCAELIRAVQKKMTILMGEVSTTPDNWEKYRVAYGSICQEDLDLLDTVIADLDPHISKDQRGWSYPGDYSNTVCLERARVDCRTAERSVLMLVEFWEKRHQTDRRRRGRQHTPLNISGFATTFKYLNRLSDVLWMMARVVERQIQPGGYADANHALTRALELARKLAPDIDRG